METEMVVVEDGKQMVMADMRNMLVHDMMELNGKNEWFSSKLIAEQTGKKHFTILCDLKMKAVDFANGKEYWENVVNGGKTYFNFVRSDLNNIFKILVVDKDDALIHHEFLEGLRYTFDKRGYVEEFEVNGYVANHLIMSYSNEKLWDWQMYTRSLYAENTELLADKFLSWMPDTEIDLNNLTTAQRTQVTLGMVDEWGKTEKRKIKKISKKKMKRIAAAKPVQLSVNAHDTTYITDDYKKKISVKNKAAYSRRRDALLGALNIEEDTIYSLKWLAKRFNTSENNMRLFLVKHDFIKKNIFSNGTVIPSGNSARREWMTINEAEDWCNMRDELVTVNFGSFTTQGVVMVYKKAIADAKKYKNSMNVRDRDYLPIGKDFKDFCSDYKFKI